jgi:NADPH-dependent curcumin reductase CurA
MNAPARKPAESKFRCACGPGDLSATTNQQFHLVRIPDGPLTSDCFRLAVAAIPGLKDGEVLLKTRFISVDAANRAWMQGATYRDALGAGTVMAARGVGEVVDSRHPGFTAGDLAFGDCGWQEYAALPGASLMKQPQVTPLSHLLSVYGVSGLTAYFGLTEVGQAKAGETVVISAAAGAVGTFAGQIAKILGCRVVGIAGGDEKCRWLTDELGYDAAVNYKSGPVGDNLEAACPDGIDVYFDNVGGEILETAISRMKMQGRVACCGVVSTYDTAAQHSHGPRGVPFLFVVKRLTMRGFIVSDFFGRRDEALARLRSWVEAGRLKVIEDIVEGFDNLPSALIGLLHGENRGKRMVRIG